MIFQEFRNRFKRANWGKISTLMVEIEGVFVEQKSANELSGAEYFRSMWYQVDESGMDRFGVDRYDEIQKSKSNKSNKKIDGKRL